MMKRLVFASAVLGLAVCLSASPAQALGFGLFCKKNKCDSPCAAAACGPISGCDAPCSPVVAPAPAMTTQTVTRYVAKTVTENKPVTTSSYKWVDEPHSWQECVTTPVTKKMPVTTTTYAWVDEPYTYTVCTPVTTMVQKPVCKTARRDSRWYRSGES